MGSVAAARVESRADEQERPVDRAVQPGHAHVQGDPVEQTYRHRLYPHIGPHDDAALPGGERLGDLVKPQAVGGSAGFGGGEHLKDGAVAASATSSSGSPAATSFVTRAAIRPLPITRSGPPAHFELRGSTDRAVADLSLSV
ncbi:hypothetical protein ACFYY8_17915 [Streptosporangium sp. NPDC001559]|uniref:hypothetical protein n=1 Tax=Streptosporangium sp. NPDC001559 TaxID=3366187 RepID=UPI0036E465CE